jgi:capreomycidine synthase
VEIGSALLDDWMREHLLDASIDIGSSGVEPYQLRDLRELTGLDLASLDDVVLHHSPPAGRLDLRQAIADRWGTGDPEMVVPTNGASEANYAALVTVLNPGDHVVATDPAYHTLVSVPEFLGCAIRPWRLPPERGFRPDLDELAAILAGGEHPVAAIVVNFPHNPSGATLTEDELGRLVELAGQAGAYLVWDASFAELTYEAAPLPDPARRYPKALSVGTLSKAFGLPGLRFGWCLADPALIARVTRLRDQTTISVSQLTELFALHAVRRADALVGPRLRQAAANRQVLADWARENAEYVDLPVLPAGGVTAFPALRGHADTRDLCQRLSDEHRVLLVPGAAFGHPDRVRLGFGGPAAELARGLDLLAKALRHAS